MTFYKQKKLDFKEIKLIEKQLDSYKFKRNSNVNSLFEAMEDTLNKSKNVFICEEQLLKAKEEFQVSLEKLSGYCTHPSIKQSIVEQSQWLYKVNEVEKKKVNRIKQSINFSVQYSRIKKPTEKTREKKQKDPILKRILAKEQNSKKIRINNLKQEIENILCEDATNNSQQLTLLNTTLGIIDAYVNSLPLEPFEGFCFFGDLFVVSDEIKTFMENMGWDTYLTKQSKSTMKDKNNKCAILSTK
ncbi:hypothetical protein QTN25_001348 [Entamoeba marina]